jgi:transcriptional regulator with XRE-family HTH domain
MAKTLRAYTEIGRRIAALAKTQKDIARALGIESQTVSKKLRGICSISLSELGTLSKAFKVPMTYFFGEGKPDPKSATLRKRIRSKGRTLRSLLVLAGKLSTRDQKRLVAEAKTLKK